MQTIKTGLFSKLFIFELNERELYEEYKRAYAGWYEERFINSKLAIEVTKKSLD